jgi:hypothetical protein
MATIVLAHGAWSAAWAWKKMRPLFKAAGHEFFSPTYTGLGERAHLARPEIDLATHIQDVLAVLEVEDLTVNGNDDIWFAEDSIEDQGDDWSE